VRTRDSQVCADSSSNVCVCVYVQVCVRTSDFEVSVNVYSDFEVSVNIYVCGISISICVRINES